jgi:HSP20 family protein
MSKSSFLERLTGARHKDAAPASASNGAHDSDATESPVITVRTEEETPQSDRAAADEAELLDESREGQLAVDVYQTPTDIVVKTFTAGVKPEEVDIAITRDMLTIRGSRAEARTIAEDDYLHRELYWGTFSRTVLLPAEVDPEQAEAVARHGLLIIKLPKLDKDRQTKLKVRHA